MRPPASRWRRRTGPRPVRTGSRSARPTSSTSAAISHAPNRGGPTRSSVPAGSSSPTPAAARARTSATPFGQRAAPSRDWAARTAYNRSQILYRIAELMEGRRDQFVAEVVTAEGVTRPRATRLVDAAIDRWVWYAGWADKYPQIIGTVNPVAGRYFNFSVPEPTGVVGDHRPGGVIAPGIGQPARAGHRERQRGRGPRVRVAAAAGGDADRGLRHLRRAGRRREPHHRACDAS